MSEQTQAGNGTEKQQRGTIARNPRIVAISKISEIIESLGDDDSRAAALNFIVTEYRRFLNVVE